jgi:hypothetical protein
MWLHFILHRKSWCNGKNFAHQVGEGEAFKSSFLQLIYYSLCNIIYVVNLGWSALSYAT